MLEDELESRFVERGEARLHYKIAGRGPAILFLHGLPDFWFGWRHQIASFLPSHTVLAPDLRGINLSSAPPAVDHYKMALLVGDALAVLDAADIDRAVIVGHDWGGVIAWWLATFHPERVEKLVTIAAPHPIDYLTALRAKPEALNYLRPLTDGSDWDAAVRLMTRWAPGAYGERLAAVIRQAGRDRILAYYKANVLDSGGISYGHEKVEKPTLALRIVGDAAVPIEGFDGVAGRVAGSLRVESIESDEHFLHQIRPLQITSLIKSFVA